MPERHQPERTQSPSSSSELDALIRSSIATYGEPAPYSELAQRILIRIAAEPEPVARRRWLPWAIALPVAASLVAIFILIETRPVHAPAGLTDQARVAAPLVNSPAASLAQDAPYRTQREKRNSLPRNNVRPQMAAVVAKVQPLPKLNVFPTPQPLTPEEQALVQFAARAPAAERKALLDEQKQTDAPLTIAAIKIQPIELPELGMN
jgi:hypothetical protein